MRLEDISDESLHHAYVLQGGMRAFAAARARAADFLQTPFEGNPDVFFAEYESFGIDDARNIRDHRALKSVGPISVACILALNITPDAQNALLKTLEEPAGRSVLFLVVPSTARLLPTLRSRFIEIESIEDDGVEVTAYLRAHPAKRFEMVADIVEKKDKAAARALLRGIVRALHARMRAGDKDLAGPLAEIERIAQFLDDQSASIKLITEHIALTTPRLRE